LKALTALVEWGEMAESALTEIAEDVSLET
jgi:hypothetical protein